jgi:hypothetical protein
VNRRGIVDRRERICELPKKASGLPGERDIEKKVLELNIPPYQSETKTHSKFVSVAE